MITLAMAEDHQALVDGVISFVKDEEDIEVVGYANDGEELLQLMRRKRPKVVLCDIRMPKMDGIEVTKRIMEEFPNTKIIAFTMMDSPEMVSEMVEAGVKGFILKNSTLSVVLKAIRTVYEGEVYFDEHISTTDRKRSSSKSILSKREREILRLIANGKTSHQIAYVLNIGKTTVDTHRKNMIRKLGLNGAGELLRYALDTKYEF